MKVQTLLNPVQPISPLTEARYPSEFSMNHLVDLPTFRDKILYAQSSLVQLGSGSSRVAFGVDKDTVLKVAKNKKGLAQNKAENDPRMQDFNIIAKLIEADPSNIFLEMERARPCTDEDFENILGFSLDDLDEYLRYIKHNKKPSPAFADFIKWLETSWWLNELTRFATYFGFMIPGDFVKSDSYGIVKRDGKSIVVLVDYGFTQEVWSDHYSGDKRNEYGSGDYNSRA